uniref:DUF4371 domain-containing protein n=1 Tax=Pygocentrus nattereri TaxID=42514 RepID=A0AAR2JRD4_PYGNA
MTRRPLFPGHVLLLRPISKTEFETEFQNRPGFCSTASNIIHVDCIVIRIATPFQVSLYRKLATPFSSNLSNESADTIAQYIKDTLQKKGIFSKCIALTGDNCNTMFGGIRRNEEGKNVFAHLKKSLQNTALIGVGCPAHILNNCVHHGADTLDLDIEQIIFKIYHHFNIYTVRTENLKEYCEFADVNYRALLSHSKTRWLSLFPGIERLLQMYPALKAFFLRFFEDEFSEIYLWQMHSLISVFQSNIQEMEREDNSVVEVKRILNKVQSLLHERKMNNFMPLKVKSMLAQKQKDGYGQRCDNFSAQVQGLYSSCLDYLQKWMATMEEFSIFMWVDLSEITDWNDVEACIKNLAEKGVEVDDAKCFDQVTNLKKFIEKNGAEFSDLQAHQRWTKFFERSKSVDFHSELPKMVQFFLNTCPQCKCGSYKSTSHFGVLMSLYTALDVMTPVSVNSH